MKDLTKFYSDFDELFKKFPVVEKKLLGYPDSIIECGDGEIVVHCCDDYDDSFLNEDDCFKISHYFALLGHLLFVINKEGENGQKETK